MKKYSLILCLFIFIIGTTLRAQTKIIPGAELAAPREKELNGTLETLQDKRLSIEAEKQALEALRLSNERFSAGAGTQLDVLDARTALTQARTTEIEARAAYNKQLAEFDRVTATDTVYGETFKDPLTERKSPKVAPMKKAAPAKAQ